MELFFLLFPFFLYILPDFRLCSLYLFIFYNVYFFERGRTRINIVSCGCEVGFVTCFLILFIICRSIRRSLCFHSFFSHEGSACLELKPFLELFYFLFLISLLGVKSLKDVFNHKSVILFFIFYFSILIVDLLTLYLIFFFHRMEHLFRVPFLSTG